MAPKGRDPRRERASGALGGRTLSLLTLAATLLTGAAAQSCPALPVVYPPDGSGVGANALSPLELDAAATYVSDLRFLSGGTVLALTSSGHLWRSVNGGATWADETARLTGALDNRGVSAMVLPPTGAPSHALFVGHYNASLRATLMWSTRTGGFDFEQPCALVGGGERCVSAPDDLVVSVKPHPRAPETVALLTRRRLCAGASSNCFRTDVLVSQDYGRTWSSSLARAAQGGEGSLIVGFIDFDWAPEASGATPSNALLAAAYLTADEQTRGLYYAGWWDKGVHMVLSRNLFQTRTVVRRCANAFQVMTDGRTYAGVAGGCDAPRSASDGWAVTLEVSANGGASWQVGCFPSFEAEHGYTLYEVPSGSPGAPSDVFIHVDHSDTREPLKTGQPLGALYHADAAGHLFSLSQRDVLLQPSGVSDFMPARNLSGVAFANSVDAALWTDVRFLSGDKTAYDAVATRVSRDAGANWAQLPAPAPMAGQPACSGAACFLQLHGPDALWRANISYPGLYSPANAPGVLFSTGSVGAHLSYEPSDVRTYLSTDGGSSWATVAANAHTYEVAAFGNLLVIAAAGPSGVTSVVHFSIDGGACWDSVRLAVPMEVHNIQTRADNGGLLLICHGHLPDRSRLAMYVLDFSSLLAAAGLPTCSASDFETWAPEGCQAGSSAVFTRRKVHARCLPTPSWTPSRSASRPCGCSASDYECAFGYERAGASRACVPMPDFAVDPGCPDKAASSTRLIAGDVCTNAPAGRTKRHGPSGGVIFLIVVLVLGVVSTCAVCVARFLGLPLPPALRDGVDDSWAAISSGMARLKGGHRRLSPDAEEAWLDSPEASFSPLAGSYVPPRS